MAPTGVEIYDEQSSLFAVHQLEEVLRILDLQNKRIELIQFFDKLQDFT